MNDLLELKEREERLRAEYELEKALSAIEQHAGLEARVALKRYGVTRPKA